MSDEKRNFHGNVDRRRFLVETGEAFGLAGAAALGVPAVALAKKRNIEFIRTNCGEDGATKRILVAYASRCGSTGGVAEAIAKELCAAGAACDVRLVKEVTDISPYDAVVIGSAARAARWLYEAPRFVYENKEALSKIPVAYFITCMQVVPEQPGITPTGPPPKDETIEQKRARVKTYMNPVLKKAPEVKPVDTGVFAGELYFDKMSKGAKTMMKSAGFIEGDWRDWDRIREWAKAIAPKLLAA